MSTYRVEALKQIGFTFDKTNTAEALWQKRYHELVEFKMKYGHCNVPQKYPVNQPLGKWVHRQRFQMKKLKYGDTSSLSFHRAEALELIGFCYNPPNSEEEIWQQRFQQLIAYRNQNGHCNVPRNYCPDKQFGHWVNMQKINLMRFRHGSKIISSDKATALTKIGLLAV